MVKALSEEKYMDIQNILESCYQNVPLLILESSGNNVNIFL